MAKYIDPCEVCEEYIKGAICDNDKCPVEKMKAENEALKKENSRMKAENEALKKEISRLRLEMSYMKSPNKIGDRHEMGAW